jgi:CheY-like chemotaxis protein
VLVAEDEPSVRLLVRIALSGQGYTLLEAADGQDALEVAERHDGRIDLLLTDIVMPRVSGPELAARLGLPVLYMSGYAEPDVTPIAELDAENFIAKPFSPPELARRVRERLDQPAPRRGAATATPRLRPS